MKMTPESVLTPDFARSVVRFTTLHTGSAVFDDDLVQEALLRGLKAFRRTVHVEHPRAFFMKIVRDTVRDHWRRRRVLLLSLGSVPEGELGHVVDIEAKLDRDDKLRQIRTAMSSLASEQRVLMELFYFEEFSIPQLTVLLGKSRSALKMALLRSRNKVMSSVAEDAIPARR